MQSLQSPNACIGASARTCFWGLAAAVCKFLGLNVPRWTGDDEHPGQHLSAEIAVSPVADSRSWRIARRQPKESRRGQYALPPRVTHSTAGWKQKAVLLKEESIFRATERLRWGNDRTDFSDLMQALLDGWLQTQE